MPRLRYYEFFGSFLSVCCSQVWVKLFADTERILFPPSLPLRQATPRWPCFSWELTIKRAAAAYILLGEADRERERRMLPSLTCAHLLSLIKTLWTHWTCDLTFLPDSVLLEILKNQWKIPLHNSYNFLFLLPRLILLKSCSQKASLFSDYTDGRRIFRKIDRDTNRDITGKARWEPDFILCGIIGLKKKT